MNIEEHIENLKAIASDMPSDKCSDWIESLMTGINAMEELQAHREAWTVVANAMKECSYKIWHEFGEYVGEDCEQIEIINLKTALGILEDYRPKESDSNDNKE